MHMAWLIQLSSHSV